MKTWAIQITFHLTDEDDEFAPREWDPSALLEVASSQAVSKHWQFTELVRGSATTFSSAGDTLMPDSNVAEQ